MNNTPLLKPGDFVNYFGEAHLILELCEQPDNGRQNICYTIYDERRCIAMHINPMLFVQATANMIDKRAARRQAIKYFVEPEELTTKLKVFGLIP